MLFPKIIKAGLIIGGESGDGVLRVGGKADGFYNISAAWFGLQAGGQRFSYALFFMTDGALQYLQKSDGWSIGSGPNVVVVDQRAAVSMTSTTLSQDVYAIPFGQKDLMAGLGLEGSKVPRIHRGPQPLPRPSMISVVMPVWLIPMVYTAASRVADVVLPRIEHKYFAGHLHQVSVG